MLTRFKSSGDHGSAQTSYLLNKHCAKTLYLSGDQLCYLYSIMIGAPTVFRYFAGSGVSGEEEAGDGDNICEPNLERTHFIGTYLPPPDEKAIFKRQLERQREFLEKHLKKTDSPRNTPQIQSPHDFPVELNNNIKFMDSIRESVINTTTPDQTNTIITQNKQTLKTIKSNIRKFFDKMNNTDQIDENVKKSMNTAEKLLHNLYFMENAEKIRKLYEDTFQIQKEFMERNVVRISKRKRNSASLSTGSITMMHLKSRFGEFESDLSDARERARAFINVLRKDTGTDTLFKEVEKLKKKFWQSVTNTSSKVKTHYSGSAIFLQEQGRNMLNAKYATVNDELALLKNGMGEVIAEFFEIANVAPVVAEPVSEAEARQSSETSKTSASSQNGNPKRQRVTTPSRGSPTSVTMEEE